MTDFHREREIAREAARLAARLCLAVRAEMLGRADHMEKVGREPVTVADFGAQAVILHHLAEHFPADAVLAEERAADFEHLADTAQRERVLHHVGAVSGRAVTAQDIARWLDHGRGRHSSRIWTVDPIDGTKGFLRGDQFAIAVALLMHGEPVVAALACPLLPFGAGGAINARGVIALAVRGEGATLEPLEGDFQRPLRVSRCTDASAARVVESVEVAHTDHDFSAQVMAAAGVGGQPVRMDSQAKYVAVADGRAEIYLRNSPGSGYAEKVWDHAAGVLIVQEAGGRISDLDGRPLNFSRGARLSGNRGVLATNGPLHEMLLAAIRRVADVHP